MPPLRKEGKGNTAMIEKTSKFTVRNSRRVAVRYILKPEQMHPCTPTISEIASCCMSCLIYWNMMNCEQLDPIPLKRSKPCQR